MTDHELMVNYMIIRIKIIRRQAKAPSMDHQLLPTATREVLATHCGLTLYKERVAEVAVFVAKKILQNLNFRKFLTLKF